MEETWLTHDVGDNLGQAVDFLAAELERAGVVLRTGPRALNTEPFWRQAGVSLLNPRKVGAWCIYVTEAMLGREWSLAQITDAAAKLAERRPGNLPIVLLIPGSSAALPVSSALAALPAVKMSEQYWAERLRAAVEGRRPEIPPPGMPPYTVVLHHWGQAGHQEQALEIRPREGSWRPFVAGVHVKEKDLVRPRLVYGPRGRVPADTPGAGACGETSADGEWWLLKGPAPADRVNSYYLRHDRMPETVLFGIDGGRATYIARLRPVTRRLTR